MPHGLTDDLQHTRLQVSGTAPTFGRGFPFCWSSARKPWWRRWSEPIVVATIFGSLIAVFVMSGAAGFQSIKGDIHASEARVHEEVRTSEARLHEEIQSSEARLTERIQANEMMIQTTEVKLRDEIHASEARLNKRIDDLREDFKDLRGEFKAEIGSVNDRLDAMNDKMDRVLETLLAS
ncbi:MAG: hypothetical protein F4Z75_02235, partial [Synechococcus sp. SB0668_bin_15]|nr:hypothetical protein [Synechococcus sp. SB0668_bin_15]MYC49818.1 hypothetical protein [Synechococcus sp. SB0662_bin_14]